MSDQGADSLLQRVEELERRVGQMVVRGKIYAVDPKSVKAKVEYGEGLVSGWLPWKPSRAGKAIVWWTPEVGEGATIISDGDLSLGEIIPGSYQNDYPAPSDDPDLFHVNFGNGTIIEYHRTEERFTATVIGELSILVTGNLTAHADGDANVTATNIRHNGGAGVVTGAHKCLVLGVPHADCSSTVFAGQ